MLRVGGALLIILGFGLIGLLIAQNYGLRPLQIRYLQNALQLLETEISYGLTPLPKALRQVGQAMPAPVGGLFLASAEGIVGGQKSIQEAWQEALAQLAQFSALRQKEMEALYYFGQNLGESDLLAQQKNFKLLQEQLRLFYQEAIEEKNRNQKIWQYLGFTFGTALALVLI